MKRGLDTLGRIAGSWHRLSVLYRLYLVAYVWLETRRKFHRLIIKGLAIMIGILTSGIYLGYLLANLVP